MTTVNNLFASKPQDVRKLMPPHVLGPEPKRREPTAEEIQANWQILRDRVRRGGRKHGRE